MAVQICNCGLVRQRVFRTSSGVDACSRCNLPINFSTEAFSQEELDEVIAAEAEQLAKLSIQGRSAKHNREIAESLVNQLAGGKKYARALKKGQFATFSFIGTEDWEDYASLSIRALQLLAVTRIDENLEKLVQILEKDS